MEKQWFGPIARTVACAVLVFVAGSLPAIAQMETGRVVGVVVDQQDAVLPGATVTLTGVGTGVSRTAVTDDRGAYVFANVLPGEYEVRVELSGFAPRQSRAVVAVGSTVTVNVSLPLAGIQVEAIQVTAEVPLVNVATQEVATVITETQIRELPSITRNIYDFVGVSGNVSRDDPSDRGAGFAMNGLRSASTNILLDGAANNDEFTGAEGQAVPLDAVQEFSVVTSNFSPQYGRAAAGVINVVTKSGTNELRGTAYSFFRNEKMATRTFDEEERDLEKSPFSRSQTGFSVGGPLQRDRVHFFGAAEYIRVRSEGSDIAWVPTPEFLALTSPATRNFFSRFTPTPINGPVLRAGEIAGVTPGGAFASIPANTPVFGQVQRKIPIDAGGGDPVDDLQLVARVDMAVSGDTNVYVRYALQDQEFLEGSNSNSPYQGFNTGELNKNHNLLGSYTRVWSNTFTTQSKIVFNRLRNAQPLGESPPVPGLYMRTSRTTINGIRVALPGYLPYNPGSAIPFGGPQNLLQLYQDGTKIWGNHDLRFGGSFVRIMDNRSFGAFQNSVQTLGNNLGQALDNLVLGQIVSFQGAVNPQGRFPGERITLPVQPPLFSRENRYNEWALYFNDSWHAANRLTLNLGLRYEYFGVQKNSDPSLDSNFYYGEGRTIQERIRNGRIMPAPDSPIGSLWKPDKNNFAPRVGFAYDLSGDGRTAIRGGYGIGYERNFGNVTFNVIQNPPAYAVIALRAPSDVPTLPLTTENAGPLAGTGTAVLPPTSARHVDQNIVNAYAHFWSTAIQRELFRGAVVGVEYVGSAGEKQYSLTNPNRPGTGAIFLGDASTTTRLNLQYTGMNTRGNQGKSRYHGVISSVELRRLGDLGLMLTGRYTYGRAKDNLSTTFSESNNNFNLGTLDAFDPDVDYGWADYDVRHRLAISGIYELPFLKNAEGLARTLGGGWQISGIFTAQTGAPFTIFDCTNANEVCARMRQVASIADYQVTKTGPNMYMYLDLSNQQAGVGTIVNSRIGNNNVAPEGGWPSDMTERNAFRRPGRWNVDASFGKRFRFTDQVGIQVRFEVYNLFKHANLFVDDSNADISSADVITAFRGYTSALPDAMRGDGQRRMQLGVKLEF